MDKTWNFSPPSPLDVITQAQAENERLREKVRELRGFRDDAMRYRLLKTLISERSLHADIDGYNGGNLDERLDEIGQSFLK